MWTLYTPDAQTEYPTIEHFLVFIGSNDTQMLEAAKHAAKSGFDRTATLSGGFASLASSHEDVRHLSAAMLCHPVPSTLLLLLGVKSRSIILMQTEVCTINRDAVAAILEQVDAGPLPRTVVIDVRRHDELALYGSIPGIFTASEKLVYHLCGTVRRMIVLLLCPSLCMLVS